jgi:hypothetical protein
MSSLTINPKWNSEINQVENGEPITGGALGNANLASRQLGENIFYLKQKVENDLATKANKADVYTKTDTDEKYALKATTISGYGITDAYTKIQIDNKFVEIDSKVGNLNTLKTTDKTQLVKSINEVIDSTKGVVDLYNKNVEAGAGENGWTTALIEEDGKTQKQINADQKVKNELWIDITDKLTDSTTNNVSVLNQAIEIAKSQNKGIRCAPRSTVNLNADVDFSGIRFIDFKADILLSAGKKVIIGGFSQSALTCYFKFASITDGSSVFGEPPTTPTFRVAGLKNAVLELGTTNYLQLYADANDATKNSTAYNDIKLSGWIPKLEITDSGTIVGGVGGWVNENRIWGGRIYWLRMAGNGYVHNHNKFYNNTFEGDKVRLDFINVWTNQIYGARFEGVAAAHGVSFDSTSMENSVEQTWTGTGNTNSQFDFSPKVTDLGKANICYTHYSTIFTKTELFSVNASMLISDGVTTASQHYYFGRPKSIFTDYPNFVPNLTNFTVSAYRLLALTDMIPVKVGDSVKFDTDYDGSLLRPLVWCYDDNQKLITDTTGGDLIALIGGTFDGERYSTGANLPSFALDTGFSILNSRVKYIQVSVFSGSAGTVHHLSAHLYTQNLKRAKSITSANTRIKVPQLANDVTKGFVSVGFEIYNSTFKNRNHVTFAFETRLSATANAIGTVINIASATGIKNGDIVGVQLDDGTTHWSKVSNLSGTTHMIDALPSIASQNARVVYNRWAVINYSVALNAATYASGVTTLTYTVVGAVIGQKVMVNHNKSLGALIVKGDVTATDTVTVTVYNPTAAGIAVVAGNIYLSIE